MMKELLIVLLTAVAFSVDSNWHFFLVDGAKYSGSLENIQEVKDPTKKLGEVQCCNTALTQCTRKNANNQCLSGDNDAAKYSYAEAESLCQNLSPTGTWDLCTKKFLEITKPEICEGKGCSHDNALVWVKKEQNNPTPVVTTQIYWTMGFVDPSAQTETIGKKGDHLLFEWFGEYNIYLMPNKEAFDDCNFKEAVLLSNTSPYMYQITQRETYFACSIKNYCNNGQKLHVSAPACDWDYGVPNKMNLHASYDHRRNMIVGGQISTPHEYPWQVKLEIDGYSCGGTIIGDRWILTAAHCGVKKGVTPIVHAGLGTLSIEGEFIWHEGYDKVNNKNDIALIRLNEDLPCDNPNIKPISLADKRNFDVNGCSAWVTGFGKLKFDGRPSYLNSYDNYEVQTKIWDTDHCNKNALKKSSFKNIPNTQLCGFTPDNASEDSCQGDSGGPFIIDTDTTTTNHLYVQAGIVSYGNGCGGENGILDVGQGGWLGYISPGIYTDVSEYRSWITKHFPDAHFTSITDCDKKWYHEGVHNGCRSGDCKLELPPCKGKREKWKSNSGESCGDIELINCFATKGDDALFAYQACQKCHQCGTYINKENITKQDINNSKKLRRRRQF